MSIQTDNFGEDFNPAPRVVSAAPVSPREEAIERALRPKLLQEYVGQAKVREQLEIFIGAARNRDEALRFLSHDMRAPQTSILALLELQNEPESALPQKELFSRIKTASRKTLSLADNFVQLARAESQEYRLEEVDFQDLLLDANDEMWSLAKAKNIILKTDISEDEFLLHADRTLMTRALTNLISNAIHYSPEHTEITCTLKREVTADAAHVVCTISDQGYGIAVADQDKLFQRFRRVSTPDQPTQNGSGLGLILVKTVIERHRGKISLVSEVGKGSRFVIEIPC